MHEPIFFKRELTWHHKFAYWSDVVTFFLQALSSLSKWSSRTKAMTSPICSDSFRSQRVMPCGRSWSSSKSCLPMLPSLVSAASFAVIKSGNFRIKILFKCLYYCFQNANLGYYWKILWVRINVIESELIKIFLLFPCPALHRMNANLSSNCLPWKFSR